MVWVNLLPWRQAALRQRGRIWGLLALGGLLVLVGLLLSGQAQRSLNQQQAEVQAMWRSASQLASQLTERTAVAGQELERLHRYQDEQQQRQQRLAGWRHFAQTLGEQFPADLWLQQLVKNDHGLEMGGFAASIAGLHQLRQQLGNMPLLRQVTLGQIQRSGDQVLKFAMQAQLTGPEEHHDD